MPTISYPFFSSKSKETVVNATTDVQLGLTDLPAENDIFDIDLYRDSIARFIEHCKTPMTISIQGTWGTGKTTFMKMVKAKLNNSKFIEFNTWQFSQFDMDSDLSLNLIRSLIDDMGLEEEQKKGIKVAINGAKVMGGATAVVLEKLFGLGNLGGEAKEIVERVMKALADSRTESPVNAVKEIKKEFEECVKKCKQKANKDRVVIFIDDLDRLEPRKAVELLEVLKNFLDCRDCVFILAIDYGVVQKGVAAKYGATDGNSALDRKKGKDFFDKIIQVPFQMPVAQYNIQKYLKTCLQNIMENGAPLFSADEDYTNYYSFAFNSVGANPRAIKRLTNSFQLLVLVVQMHKELDIRKCKKLLFASLCLQELDSNVYNGIVRDRDDLSEEKLMSFVEKDIERIAKFYPTLNLEEESDGCVDIDKIAQFMKELISIIDIDGKSGISDEEIKNFSDVLNLTSITSADENSGQQNEVIRKRASVQRTSLEELTKAVNIGACRKLTEMIKNEGGVEPILKDRPQDVSIVADFGRPDKLQIQFFEYANGSAFSVWCEARESFFAKIPESFQVILDRKNKERKRPIKPNRVSAGGKNMYFTFKASHDDENDQNDIAELLRACKSAEWPE